MLQGKNDVSQQKLVLLFYYLSRLVYAHASKD